MVSQESIRLCVICKLFEVVVVRIESGEHILIELFSLLLQLSFGQISKVVVGLPYQLLRVEESVDEKSATADHPWNPTVG